MSRLPPELGAQLLQRDWLSANHTVFVGGDGAPATVVDTGYARHGAMSQALIDHALAGEPLGRIVNTHLHSDHCGGNAMLQARDPSLQVWVPQGSVDLVRVWDEARLSYRYTGQQCPPFRVDGALVPGQVLRLGPADWQIHAAPGHDPDAVMLFEPQTRCLIAGDALWEDRLAIIFPELEGRDGFGPTEATLALIERLAPRVVVPGHGPAFEDVAAALASSRRRLDAFRRDPLRHLRHAARALLMFHMMEHRHRPRAELIEWLPRTPVFAAMARGSQADPSVWGRELVDGLLDDGLLADHDGVLHWAVAPSR
ncbi:MAG: MBL fold metallo-hydrolase [Burkholderiales bacterium]|nr:MBL fold metallo-hydrolase [Burkholderiales bacterium]